MPRQKGLPPLVHVYQNNMLLHISVQMWLLDCSSLCAKTDSPPPTDNPSKMTAPLPPTPKQHNPLPSPLSAEIVDLCQEVLALRQEFNEYKLMHETCCLPPPMSAQPPVIDDMAAPCLAFPPSSSTTSTVSIHSLHAHPDHPQLQDLLDWDELPPSFCHINNTMEPTMSKHMPEDVESILKLVFKDA